MNMIINRNYFDIDYIKKIILNKNISHVSFDIFDTMLVRPVIFPTDIFYILEKKILTELNIDIKKLKFVETRRESEKKVTFELKIDPNIDQIYDYLSRNYNISKDDSIKIKQMELDIEYNLLKKRNEIYDLYNFCVKNNKEVICISDMYLRSNFLESVLKKNGYSNIKRIYVSNECRCSKRNGKIFDVVIDDLKISSNNIVHIGDNLWSDYQVPISLNIQSFYFPSSLVILQKRYPKLFENLNKISADPITRVIIGYFINKIFEQRFVNSKLDNDDNLIKSKQCFVTLCLSCVLIPAVIKMSFSSDIQNFQKYNKILFASRDGYLIKIIYDIFCLNFEKLLPSKYIYTGRKTYCFAPFSSFEEFIKNLKNSKTKYNPSLFVSKFFCSPLLMVLHKNKLEIIINLI